MLLESKHSTTGLNSRSSCLYTAESLEFSARVMAAMTRERITAAPALHDSPPYCSPVAGSSRCYHSILLRGIASLACTTDSSNVLKERPYSAGDVKAALERKGFLIVSCDEAY